ncbi:MAG: hypothetical protein U0X41_06900 [Chitinophagales bacterium]
MQINFLRNKIIDYPSGSALEYRNGISYLIGDDVNHILMLDDDWNVIGRLQLFEYDGLRIPKPEKPDLECATIIGDMLYVVGSGSVSPQRDVAFWVNLAEEKIKKISTTAFYSIFRDRNLIAAMNIEGFTDCKDKLLLFNRGNTQEANQLIITDHKILKKQFPDRFKVMPVTIGKLKGTNLGISGACYDAVNDVVLLSASAENTSNAYDDGEIIGSVIGVAYNAYQKLSDAEFSVDEWIELESVHPKFNKQKVESICISQQYDKSYTCTLVADNDDGKSVLFEVEIIL